MNYIKDDLFKINISIIAHGANTSGAIEKIIKDRYPDVYKKYRNYFLRNGLKLGEVIFSSSKDKYIYHLITQNKHGNDGKTYIDYDAIRKCVTNLNFLCKNQTIAMSMIGSGLGGGDWNKNSKIIEQELTNVETYVYYI